MNEEQAVERILRGDPWRTCIICKGGRKDPESLRRYEAAFDKWSVHHRVGELPPSVDEYLRWCAGCRGEGSLIEAEYADACKLLGRPLPESPNSLYLETMKTIQSQALESVKRDVAMFGNALVQVKEGHVWGRALTPEEAADIYNKGAASVPGGKRII